MQVDIIINLLLNFIRSINNTPKIPPFFFILLPLKCRAAATASSRWGNGGNIRQTDCFWFNWFYMVWRLFLSGSNETVFDITPSSYEVSWNSAVVTMAIGTFWGRQTHFWLCIKRSIAYIQVSSVLDSLETCPDDFTNDIWKRKKKKKKCKKSTSWLWSRKVCLTYSDS